jgi:DNA-binding response OmpR family regulator
MTNGKILVIEDDRLVRRVITDILKNRDYDVDSADSGEDGIAKAEKSSYDVILLDIHLPGIDGIETLREIRKAQPESSVIMLTGSPTLETVKDAIKIGAVDYLSKTTDPDKLNEVIQKAIRNRKEAKAKQSKNARTVVDEIFLIYRNGELIKHFTRRLKPDIDPEILSSMFVAVQNFVKDSFRREAGELNELQFGKFRILICRGKWIILAVVIKGEDIAVLKKQLSRTVRDMEKEKPERLENWKGVLDNLAYLEKHVKKFIEEA